MLFKLKITNNKNKFKSTHLRKAIRPNFLICFDDEIEQISYGTNSKWTLPNKPKLAIYLNFNKKTALSD